MKTLRVLSFVVFTVSAMGAHGAGVFGSSFGDYDDFVAQCGGSQNIDELGVCGGGGFIAYCHACGTPTALSGACNDYCAAGEQASWCDTWDEEEVGICECQPCSEESCDAT